MFHVGRQYSAIKGISNFVIELTTLTLIPTGIDSNSFWGRKLIQHCLTFMLICMGFVIKATISRQIFNTTVIFTINVEILMNFYKLKKKRVDCSASKSKSFTRTETTIL